MWISFRTRFLICVVSANVSQGSVQHPHHHLNTCPQHTTHFPSVGCTSYATQEPTEFTGCRRESSRRCVIIPPIHVVPQQQTRHEIRMNITTQLMTFVVAYVADKNVCTWSWFSYRTQLSLHIYTCVFVFVLHQVHDTIQNLGFQIIYVKHWTQMCCV